MEYHTNAQIAQALESDERAAAQTYQRAPQKRGGTEQLHQRPHRSFLMSTVASAISIATVASVVLYANTELKGIFGNAKNPASFPDKNVLAATAIVDTVTQLPYHPFVPPEFWEENIAKNARRKEQLLQGQEERLPEDITPRVLEDILKPSALKPQMTVTAVPEVLTRLTLPSKIPSKKEYTLPQLILPGDAEEQIAAYARATGRRYSDNAYFKERRLEDALEELFALNDASTPYAIVINKTFQKAGIFRNDPGQRFMPYYPVGEVDCSTAKIYGKKHHSGDGKTPEGVYPAQDIRRGDRLLFDGKRAYGPYVFTILDHIWGHGNGSSFKGDPRTYQPPEPLGITPQDEKNKTVYNFGYGRSHGCTRFDNAQMKTFIEEGIITEGTPIIIFENKEMTKLLRKYYTITHQASHDSIAVATAKKPYKSYMTNHASEKLHATTRAYMRAYTQKHALFPSGVKDTVAYQGESHAITRSHR